MRKTPILLLAGLAAFSSVARALDAPPAAPPAAAPVTAPAADAAVTAAETTKKAAAIGYSPRLKAGVTRYCKSEAAIGTRFSSEHCISAEQVGVAYEHSQELRDRMLQPHPCGDKACGGG
jgi:hypothetical protein